MSDYTEAISKDELRRYEALQLAVSFTISSQASLAATSPWIPEQGQIEKFAAEFEAYLKGDGG